MSRLSTYLDEQRRYAREARRQKFMLGNQDRANHYAFKALAALALVQLELDTQHKRARLGETPFDPRNRGPDKPERARFPISNPEVVHHRGGPSTS